MDRKAIAALASLAILSVAVLMGSVMAALASFDDQEVHYSAFEVPEGLLSPEPVDAVRHKPTTADLTAELAQSPIPSPSPTPTRSVLRSVPPTAQPQVPRFEISMASSAKGRGGNRTIGYEI